MAFANSAEPMGDLNTTPLIDVMLVLLVMFIITIPVATHQVEIPLPQPDPLIDVPPPDLTSNKVVIDTNNRLFWNGQAISEAQLVAALEQTKILAVEPELQFEPSANASYNTAARTLRIIKQSGVSKFGFVGTEKYRDLTG